jgi:hypothetical protein
MNELQDGLPDLNEPTRAKLQDFITKFKPKSRGPLLHHDDIVTVTFNFINLLVKEFGMEVELIFILRELIFFRIKHSSRNEQKE